MAKPPSFILQIIFHYFAWKLSLPPPPLQQEPGDLPHGGHDLARRAGPGRGGRRRVAVRADPPGGRQRQAPLAAVLLGLQRGQRRRGHGGHHEPAGGETPSIGYCAIIVITSIVMHHVF